MKENTGKLNGFWCYQKHDSGLYAGCSIPHWHEDNPKTGNWQSLQSFYCFKSMLLPSFIQRNKSSLNGLEADLMREWEGGVK